MLYSMKRETFAALRRRVVKEIDDCKRTLKWCEGELNRLETSYGYWEGMDLTYSDSVPEHLRYLDVDDPQEMGYWEIIHIMVRRSEELDALKDLRKRMNAQCTKRKAIEEPYEIIDVVLTVNDLMILIVEATCYVKSFLRDIKKNIWYQHRPYILDDWPDLDQMREFLNCCRLGRVQFSESERWTELVYPNLYEKYGHLKIYEDLME